MRSLANSSAIPWIARVQNDLQFAELAREAAN
jgi:hypothetical protein